MSYPNPNPNPNLNPNPNPDPTPTPNPNPNPSPDPNPNTNQAEAEAHASRVVGWDRKLADFQAAATSSVMDIRVYINNDPIFQVRLRA